MWLLDETTGVAYELLHEIHSGGEGRTWRSRQLGLSGRELPVAVKILSREDYFNCNLSTGEVFKLWKEQEEVIRYFSDRGFVPIQAVLWTASVPGHPPLPPELLDLPAVVTAWIDGEGLRTWSHRVEDPLARLATLRVCADALDRFHRTMHHVHRDLNPNNILVASDGIAEIIDYGLLRDATVARSGTKPIGTPSYLAPEIAEGEPYSAATDCYSFAAILYHQLLREDPPELGVRHRHALTAARLADHGYGFVASLIVGWLSDDPGARPAARGALDMLERVLHQVRINAGTSALTQDVVTHEPPGVERTTEPHLSTAVLSPEDGAALTAQLRLRQTLLPATTAFVIIIAGFVLSHLLTR